MTIDNSHVWRRRKQKMIVPQRCYYCGKIIKTGTVGAWVYDQPYRREYAHPDCRK